jgi:hypothetical protein
MNAVIKRIPVQSVTETAKHIRGPRVANGFLPNEVIDLAVCLKIQDYCPEELEGIGEFAYATFVDPTQEDLENANGKQYIIRNQNKTEENKQIEQMMASLSQGYDATEPMGIYALWRGENFPLDCRTRLKACQKAGYRALPVMVFKINDDVTEETLGDIALSLNAPKGYTYSKPAQWEDFIKASVTAVLSGRVKNEYSAIDAYLTARGFYRRYTKMKTTTAVNAIQSRVAKGGSTLVDRKERKEWVQWLGARGFDATANGEYILLSMDKDTYAWRGFCEHLMPQYNLSRGKRPAKVILWTGQTDPDQARQNLENWVKTLKSCVKDAFGMVNNSTGDAISIKAPKFESVVNIVGAIPQIIDDHEIDGNDLVLVDNY